MNELGDANPSATLLELLRYAREEALRIGLDEAAQLIELPMCSIYLRIQAEKSPSASDRSESAS
jgi:hypothetical protein